MIGRVFDTLMIGGALAIGVVASFRPPTAAPAVAAPAVPAMVPPLPKPCWPVSQLTGPDSVYLYLPCNDTRMLDSATRAQVTCTIERMKVHSGFPPYIYETYRSDARQGRLYGQGRPWLPGGRVGVIVTRAKSARQSAHGTGYGVDIIHKRDGWSNARFYKSLALHAFECGLEAGASWPTFPDAPHVQSRAFTAARKRMVGGPS